MKITLFLNDKLIDFKLPEEVSGSFSFDENDEEAWNGADNRPEGRNDIGDAKDGTDERIVGHLYDGEDDECNESDDERIKDTSYQEATESAVGESERVGKEKACTPR